MKGNISFSPEYILEISANFLEEIDEESIERIKEHSGNITGIKFCDASELKSENFLEICQLFPDIQILDVSLCTQLKGQDFKEIIKNLNKLTSLNLSQNQMASLTLSPNFNNLYILNFSDCYSLENFILLEGLDLSLLEELNFRNCSSLEATAIIKLIGLAPNLKKLDISHCHKLRDEEIKIILELATNLTDLDISDNHIEHLILPKGFDNLQNFDITRCRKLENFDFEENCDYPRLKSLNLHGLQLLPAIKIVAIIKKLPSLTNLDIGACKLEDHNLKSILDEAKNLEQITASDLRITDLSLDNANLKVADLSECDQLQTLSLNTPNLTILNLGVCIAIKELRITSTLNALRTLDLHDTQELPANEVIKLLKLAPNIEKIDITGNLESESILKWIMESKHFTKTLEIKNGDKVQIIEKQAEPLNTPTSPRTATESQLK